MEMEVEVTDEQKHSSYINLIETVALLSRGDDLNDEWIEAQIKHVQLIRRTYTDMSLVNLERQDAKIRCIAQTLELYLSGMIQEINVFGTLDTDTYLLFCQGALQLIDMVVEDEELADAFSKLLG